MLLRKLILKTNLMNLDIKNCQDKLMAEMMIEEYYLKSFIGDFMRITGNVLLNRSIYYKKIKTYHPDFFELYNKDHDDSIEDRLGGFRFPTMDHDRLNAIYSDLFSSDASIFQNGLSLIYNGKIDYIKNLINIYEMLTNNEIYECLEIPLARSKQMPFLKRIYAELNILNYSLSQSKLEEIEYSKEVTQLFIELIDDSDPTFIADLRESLIESEDPDLITFLSTFK